MSTPVLTKQQQRHSLSAKKGTTKGLRNVLAQPQDNYWPTVNAEKCAVLEELLRKFMPAIKRPCPSIPWSQLRHMKKEERAQAKKEALSKEESVPNPEIMNSVILGINAITRSLEKNNVCCILMEANIEPQLLVKHIIQMAQNKKLPILLLPKLKTITLSTIGFPSAACALKNVIMDSVDHHFHPLYMTICDIFKDIPIPDYRLQLLEDIKTPEESLLCEEDKMSIEDELETNSSKSDNKFTLSTNVYMYRTSRKERAFVPSGTVREDSTSESVKEMKEQNEFISLSNYDSDECDRSIKKNMRYIDIHKNKGKHKKHFKENGNVSYLPLKVKRVQGNANRVKATKVKQKKK